MIKTLFKASSKDIVYFRNLGNRQTILEIITEAKKELIAGLRSVEDIEGWHDPTMESAQSLWTCVEVCKSLIEAGEPIRNLDGVLEKLQNLIDDERSLELEKDTNLKELLSLDINGYVI